METSKQLYQAIDNMPCVGVGSSSDTSFPMAEDDVAISLRALKDRKSSTKAVDDDESRMNLVVGYIWQVKKNRTWEGTLTVMAGDLLEQYRTNEQTEVDVHNVEGERFCNRLKENGFHLDCNCY